MRWRGQGGRKVPLPGPGGRAECRAGLKATCRFCSSSTGTFTLRQPGTRRLLGTLGSCWRGAGPRPPTRPGLSTRAPSPPQKREGTRGRQRARTSRMFGKDGKGATDLQGRKVWSSGDTSSVRALSGSRRVFRNHDFASLFLPFHRYLLSVDTGAVSGAGGASKETELWPLPSRGLLSSCSN